MRNAGINAADDAADDGTLGTTEGKILDSEVRLGGVETKPGAVGGKIVDSEVRLGGVESKLGGEHVGSCVELELAEELEVVEEVALPPYNETK
jgi:hypothetical protein